MRWGKIMFSNNTVDVGSLDIIFDRMLETITNSKDDIFVISEQSRRSFEDMQKELEFVRQEILLIIDKVDHLEKRVQLSKQRLVTVSKNFDKFSEEQVREAYETATELQSQLSVANEQEKQLQEKRNDLERRMKALYNTIERADHLANQVNVVIQYLSSDLKNVGIALEQAKMKQDFGIKIISAQEEERKRLSREIHDGPAQMMANVLLRSGLIEKTAREKGLEAAILELSDLKVTVRNALSEVRRIIYDLRPMALDDLGIVPTLKKYISTVMEYNEGVDIHFTSTGNEDRISSDYEVAIFRLVQECLNNALKHGQSKEINVKIEWTKKDINIVVKDDGVGFDTGQVKEQSFGIIGMRERIDLLEGQMKIHSIPSKGTIVIFKIPYPDLTVL